MSITIQIRRGTAAEWTAANPVLASGELGLETDTGKIKVGNGVATWNATTYNVSSGDTVADITVGADAAPSGDGGIAYDGATATLTYTPPNVPSLETNTSIKIEGNILTYTDETGTDTDIDLSLYLDDTNLARIIQGTLDGGTGIATFERDDSTTFTVDFSPLFDDTNLARITSAAFDTGTGTITFTRDDASDITVNIDGRYHEQGTDIPDADISESSVTQHQAALVINESQIVFTSSFIELTDLSVGADAAASGSGGLAYDNTTGVFTYTPPDLSTYIALTDLSVGADAAASGSGGIAYDNSTGVFTYTPPDLSTYIALIDLSVGADAAASGSGGIAYDNSTGVFTYTPPDVPSLETTTSIALNGDSLDYTDEDGVVTNIDLSKYTDDTNLARISSATFDAVDTGDLILTRDDASTVEVNFDGRYVINETDPVFVQHTSYNITDGTGLLRNDGAGNWTYRGADLNAVDDVTITTPTARQGLIYDDPSSTWINGLQLFTDHSDININSLSTGEALLWNGATGQWYNGTVGNYAGYIDGGNAQSIYTTGDFAVDGGNA